MNKTLTKYNAIFGGGGVKGIAYLGALLALEQNGFIINRAGGTSVGSIIASLIVMGYKSTELIQIIKTTNLDNLFKPYQNNIKTTIKNKGKISNIAIYNFLKPFYIKKRCWYYHDLIKDNKPLLKVVTTQLKPFKQIIIPDDLNIINKYQFPIIDSIIMSSAYPFYFTPYKINKQIYIDGGIKQNINLNLFKDEKILTLAFTLSKNKQIYKKITNGYLINIDTNNIKTLNFKLNQQEIKNLIMQGYQTTLIWLQNEHKNHS